MVQGASGVVFRALDTATNLPVAVRRFFPFGAKGGGLGNDGQIAYNITAGRLAAIRHPALRTVIGGGCDPVDGMPYIATEWIAGQQLASLVEREPLESEAAVRLLTHALEICEILSEVLAQEAVWVETSLTSIIVGSKSSGRGVTFWIAPLKWLGANESPRGLESLITLTEEVMGWTGRTIADQEGRGLGGWLKWLRGAARTATLREAREMLAAAISVEPPLPVKRQVRQATTRRAAVARRKKKPSRLPFVAGAIAALAAIAAGGFLLIKQNQAANAAVLVELTPAAATPLPLTPSPPADLTKPVPTTPAAHKSTEESRAEATRRKAEIERRGGIFTPADHELLVALDDAQVTVEGTLAEIAYSKTRKTMHLLFSKNASVHEIRGAVRLKDAPEDLTESKLAPLIGKKIRLHGKVQLEGAIRRPVIGIENRNAIEVVE